VHDVGERRLVEQIGRAELEPVDQVSDSLVGRGRAAPYDSDDAITLREQQLGEVGAVLSSDPRDEGGWDAVKVSDGKVKGSPGELPIGQWRD
jgi:hypothetical protein